MGWRRALLDSAKGAVYFVALGPPVGALAMVGLGLVLMARESDDVLALLPVSFGMALVAMLFSWFIGAVPALVTGLLVGPLRWRFHRWRWCLLAGAIGAGVSALGLLVLPGTTAAPASLASGLANLWPGFAAGTVVARLFALRAPYPPARMPPLPLPQSAASGPPLAAQPPGIGESP